ncbi:MAG: hypothetical protein ACR2LR_24695, partial [Hassallia sp.]
MAFLDSFQQFRQRAILHGDVWRQAAKSVYAQNSRLNHAMIVIHRPLSLRLHCRIAHITRVNLA